MRLGHVAPVAFGLFVALACGSNNDESQVEGGGTAATGNINTGQAGGLGIANAPGSGGNGTGTGAGTGEPVDQDNACATSAADGEPVPVDLYFMVDTTGSMNCLVPDDPARACDADPGAPGPNETSRWELVSAALKAFMNDAGNRDLGVGIRFFPTSGNNYCRASDYSRPNVAIAPLSTNANRLVMSIDDQSPDGYTPTVASVTAAVRHANTWAEANPDHKVVVVYATDGYPKNCGSGNNIANAAAAAKAGLDGNPSILTYVLGVGPNLDDLNRIAESGGTNKAFLVDTTGDAAAQLSAALAAIRGSVALDCTYTVPAPPAGQTLDPTRVNVNYTDAKGVVSKVLQVAPNVTCANGSGWQYSADGKQINLCGALCDQVKADPGGKLQVLFGCVTEVGEPPK